MLLSSEVPWEGLCWTNFKILAQLSWVERDSLNIITTLNEVNKQGVVTS